MENKKRENLAEITIKFEKNKILYDAKECDAKQFAAVVNASIHHMEVECLEKGEDISIFLSGIRKSLDNLENFQKSVDLNENKG